MGTLRISGNTLTHGSRAITLATGTNYAAASIELTAEQDTQVEHYLTNYSIYRASHGTQDSRNPILALSYGEGVEVNGELAQALM